MPDSDDTEPRVSSSPAQPDPAEIPVFILCGGLGTRLRSIETGPKASAPVAGFPFLTYTFRLLARQGFRRIFLLAGFKAADLAAELGISEARDRTEAPGIASVPTLTRDLVETLSIRVVREKERMGTGGAVWMARDYAADLNLILNGDSYAEVCFSDLLGEVKDDVAAILGVWRKKCGEYGTLELGPTNQVDRFVEKGNPGEGWINGGVYAVPGSFFERLPSGPSSLEKDVLPVDAAAGRLQAVCLQCFFRDIGTPERFRRAQAEFAVTRRRIRDEREAAAKPEPEVG